MYTFIFKSEAAVGAEKEATRRSELLSRRKVSIICLHLSRQNPE